MLIILCLLFAFHIVGVHMQTTAESKSNDCPRFDYEYKLLERLIRIEFAQREVEATLSDLREKFQVGVHTQTTAESKSNDCPRFDYEYKLFERLIRIEFAQREVEATLAELREKFQTIPADIPRKLEDIRRLIDNKLKDPWKLVFRVTAGGGTNPYYAWRNGTGALDSDNCMMLYPSSCTKYYRNKLLDTWTTWPIEKVKFALYQNHTQVAYIVFNGTGSDSKEWLRQAGRIS
ncbi:hypothetical protein ACJMK2_036315 [Sinanodonta woodiana]|uniref:Uncharacterized protein n=1 Tax=Sinanodonta woodiana TaxID=1069815 RepID=A0ABD3WGU5_SINWO